MPHGIAILGLINVHIEGPNGCPLEEPVFERDGFVEYAVPMDQGDHILVVGNIAAESVHCQVKVLDNKGVALFPYPGVNLGPGGYLTLSLEEIFDPFQHSELVISAYAGDSPGWETKTYHVTYKISPPVVR